MTGKLQLVQAKRMSHFQGEPQIADSVVNKIQEKA